MKKNRIFTVGIPLIIALAGLSVYNYAYVVYRERSSSLKEQQSVSLRTLQMYNQAIEQTPELKRRLSSLTEMRKNEEPKLVTGSTAVLAGANLQDFVRGILTANGGTIYSERINKTESLGKYTVISVGIDAMLPSTEALSNVLYGIETRTPYMVVNELDVKLKNIMQPKELIVKLDVLGLSEAI